MKLVITADWHLDRSNRLDDFVQSISQVVSHATQHHIPKFFILGDLYRDWRASPVEKDALHRLLVKLHKFKIDVYIILGNHDVDDKDSDNGLTSTQELETLKALNVKIISEPSIIPVGDKTILAVPHLSKRYLEKERKKSKTAVTYKDVLAKFSAHSPSLVLGHMYIPEAVPCASDAASSSTRSVSLDDLKNIFKVPIILGDIHKPQQLLDNPRVVYVGSPDRINFGESGEDKRFLIYDMKSGDMQSLPIVNRDFIDIRIDLGTRSIQLKGAVSGDIPLGDGPYMDCIRTFFGVIKDRIKDSVVKFQVSGHRDLMDQIIRAELSSSLRDMKPHTVKSVTFQVTDSTSVRDAKYSELLTDTEAFNYWLGKQEYDDSFRAKVVEEASKLLKKP